MLGTTVTMGVPHKKGMEQKAGLPRRDSVIKAADGMLDRPRSQAVLWGQYLKDERERLPEQRRHSSIDWQ